MLQPSAQMDPSILLVGGELCQRVAATLHASGWQVWHLRRRPSAAPGVLSIQGDLSAPHTLCGVLPQVGHILFAPSPDQRTAACYQATYPAGLQNLLAALPCRQDLQRVLLVGSTVVWPEAGIESAASWVDERTPTLANEFRSHALLMAEAWLQQHLPQQAVTLRLGGIYGPGRTRLLDSLRHQRLLAPEGPGHWSNRIHIEDAAAACVHLLQITQPQPCYIGTDGNPAEKAAFYDQLADLLRVPRPARTPMPPTGKRLSNARLLESGWRPRWPDAVAAYRALLQV